jgi:peptidyl-prolyl cis-trans isomerase SurA
MKLNLLLAGMLLCSSAAFAQTDDPTIMTINGQPVSRSEFEYSYNKNNSEGVIDKKSVDEYVDLFVNYKLKVLAAQDAGLDTLSSFKKEFASYRDQQIRPAVITDADVENAAYKIYSETKHRVDSLGGLYRVSHILLLVGQKASPDVQAAAKARIDSIYNVLEHGGDFAELARKYSDDKGSAARGGELPWIQKGQTFKEFEDNAFALKKGEMSKPFLSPAGYHIVLMKDHQMFFPYDSVHKDILRYIKSYSIREKIIDEKLDSLAKAAVPQVTPDKVLEQKRLAMEANDPDLKNLIREYHDGLLLYDISNRTVWDKASKDEAGLASYFKKNKKKYRWDAPRFKGIAYHVKQADDVKAVKDAVKNVDFTKWADVLRQTFNNDSVIRIRVEKGIFKKGDNALVDKEIFKKDTVVTTVKNYPINAVYGTLLKAPKDYQDVRAQVVADYQDQLEKDWVSALRKKYQVNVNKDVLATVNKH